MIIDWFLLFPLAYFIFKFIKSLGFVMNNSNSHGFLRFAYFNKNVDVLKTIGHLFLSGLIAFLLWGDL